MPHRRSVAELERRPSRAYGATAALGMGRPGVDGKSTNEGSKAEPALVHKVSEILKQA